MCLVFAVFIHCYFPVWFWFPPRRASNCRRDSLQILGIVVSVFSVSFHLCCAAILQPFSSFFICRNLATLSHLCILGFVIFMQLFITGIVSFWFSLLVGWTVPDLQLTLDNLLSEHLLVSLCTCVIIYLWTYKRESY